MDRFLEMQVFTAVVDAKSFVGASEALGMSKAATSRYVADLEARLGVRLLHRTTRRLSLTEEGEVFHERCKTLLSEVDEAEAEVTSKRGRAIGLLRVAAPQSFGLLHLAPLWADFMARHPQVSLDVTLSDRLVDLVDEGFDLAVRIGQLRASSLVSRPLGSSRLVLCASPAYLRRRGRPRALTDLVQHDIVSYSLLSMGEQWSFTGPDGPETVKVQPRMRTNSGDTCRVAALQGRGIVLQPGFLVGEDLSQGTLVEVLPQYRGAELGIHAVYPSRRHVAPKVRLLLDHLVAALRQPPWPA